jgi:preprotein translocase subunit SecG
VKERKMKRQTVLLLSIFLIIGLLVVACGADEEATAVPEQAEEPAEEPG